jgi:small subunit ribosomal protein S20
MANHKSATKRNKQAIKARAKNRSAKTKVRSVVKKLREAIEANDKKTAVELLPTAQSLLGKLSKSSVMKSKTSSRKTSRLATQVAGLK